MLTSPALPDSSINLLSSQRNSAANPGGDTQSPDTGSFGKVLANELSSQRDAPETRQGESSTAPYTAAAEAGAATQPARDSKTADGDSNGPSGDVKYPETSKSAENSGELQNSKDKEGSAAVATKAPKLKEAKMHSAAAEQSQPADLAEILHGLIAAYSPQSQSDTSTPSPAEKIGKTEKSEKGEKTETPAELRAADASADARTQLATPTDLAAFPSVLPGVAGARPGRAESFDALAATAGRAASDPTFSTATHRTAAAAQAREKHASSIFDTREQASNKLDVDTRQAPATQMEFGLPGTSTGAQPGKPENPLPEFASKDFTSGLFNTSAVSAGGATDRGIAPTLAGMPPYGGANTSPGLEPRLGAAGGTTLWARKSCGWFLNSNR